MSKLLKTKSLNWSDVNLIAQPGIVKSRSEIIPIPSRIVVSAMTSIIGPTFIAAVANLPRILRPTLHIPRDIFKVDNLKLCIDYKLYNSFIGVGLKEDKSYEDFALKHGFNIAFIDIANGYLPQIPTRIKQLKDKGFTNIICGSVHTVEGAKNLERYGATVIRSGIAPGSVCITKDSTGFTRGTFTEISEIYNSLEVNCNLLADGGIKSPSDCVKAFLAGADYIMSGRLFVEARECRMHCSEDERSYSEHECFPKGVYFGMASNLGKIAMGNPNPNDHIEGTTNIITPKVSLEWILETIWYGIKSGVSYSGYNKLVDAIGKGVFEEVG